MDVQRNSLDHTTTVFTDLSGLRARSLSLLTSQGQCDLCTHREALVMESLCEKTSWGWVSIVHWGRGCGCCEAVLISSMWSWRELCHWPKSPLSSGPMYVTPTPSLQIHLTSELGYSHRLQGTPPSLTPCSPFLHPSPSTPMLKFFSFPEHVVIFLCCLEAFVPKPQSTHLPACPAPFSTMGSL